MQTDFDGIAEMRDKEVQHDPEQDQDARNHAASNLKPFVRMVEIAQTEEACEHAGEHVHRTDPEGDHHPAHQAR